MCLIPRQILAPRFLKNKNMFNPQELIVYKALEASGNLGIACFDFYSKTGSTQPNARVNGIRKELGCICKHTKGEVKWDCPAKEHIVNNGNTTFLVRPHTYQPAFV
jgi:hypothetical protein